MRVRVLRVNGSGDGEHERSGGEVEPEHASPADRADEHPADDRTERQCSSGDRRPRAERARPLPLLGVDVADHREGARLGGGRADSHQHPAGDQQVVAGGERSHE